MSDSKNTKEKKCTKECECFDIINCAECRATMDGMMEFAEKEAEQFVLHGGPWEEVPHPGRAGRTKKTKPKA